MGRKRKPGRPKGSKNKPKTTKISAALLAKLRSIDPSEFKRGPGRPKGSTTKKRGPGRPKGSKNRKVGRPKGSTNKKYTTNMSGKTFTGTITFH